MAEYTQQDRRFSVTAPTGESDLLLMRSLTVEESISGMYSIQLACFSQTMDIKFEDMIGGPISIRMRLPEGGDVRDRYFHGIVARFSQKG